MYLYGTKRRHMKFMKIKKNQDNCLNISILWDWIEKSEYLLYWRKIS